MRWKHGSEDRQASEDRADDGGRHGVVAIMREVGVSKTTVWRWQDYFAEAGVDGLIKGRSKPPGRKPLSAAMKLKVVEKTVKEQCHALERAIDGGRNGHQPHERAAHLGRI